jgi:hypothetical protein
MKNLMGKGDSYKGEIERQLRMQHGFKVFQGVCLKRCANRDVKCDSCIRFSMFKEMQNATKDP